MQTSPSAFIPYQRTSSMCTLLSMRKTPPIFGGRKEGKAQKGHPDPDYLEDEK